MEKEHLISIVLICFYQFACGQSFTINDVRIGDTTINYVNPELSPSGDYMLWIEIDTANGFSGQVWHCALDPNTGDLIPADGKGFSTFTSNVYGRPADWGVDDNGPYYVGISNLGQFIVVRPTSATTAIVDTLSTPPDVRRRVIYPSQLPDTNKRFITYILNNNTPGGANNPVNDTFQLRFLDLDAPGNEITVETQTRTFPAAVGMDVLVPRWIKGTPYLTFGYYDNANFVQVKEFNAYNPSAPPIPVTNDPTVKADGYPVFNPFNNKQYLVSGLNGTDTAVVYSRNSFGEIFSPVEKIRPNTNNLINPALNQSHEPFFFNNQLFTTFQLNEDGGSFVNTTLNEPGEIWVTSIDSVQQATWLISDFDHSLNISEPEPYSANNKVFVYYSANLIDSAKPVLNRLFQLRRCETPMNNTFFTRRHSSPLSFSVFPNPANEQVNLEIGAEEYEVLVYDLRGLLVYRASNIDHLNLVGWSSGTYILKVITETAVAASRLIKL